MFQGLTSWANVGASLPYNDTLYESATLRAGFAGSLVDPEIILKFTASVNPVDAGAIPLDALLQYLANAPPQSFRLIDVKRIGYRQGVDLGKMQGFIGVNIPQPGDKGLVKQQGFDLPMMGF